jgi:ribonuclease HI
MGLYYVVHKGKKTGIYSTWIECKKQIDHFDGAIFKKFTNEEEAKIFLKVGFGEGKKPKSIVRKENDDKKNNLKIKEETIIGFDEDSNNQIFIYTDGSCIRLKNKLVKAGYGIYIPEKNIKIASPLLNQKLTNNRAELTAIIESIKYLDTDDLLKKICIFTDSQYSIYIFTGTGERYEKDGYKNKGVDVPNIDLIKKILELKRTYNIVLLKVRAHTDKKDEHSKGNEIADKLANEGALEDNKQNNIFLNNYKSDNEDDDGDIDKNIQMNELFELEESDFEILNNTKKNKSLKNQKLSNWFIKK